MSLEITGTGKSRGQVFEVNSIHSKTCPRDP